MIKLKCLTCNKYFYTYPSRLTGKGGHISKYCSVKCYSSRRNKQLVENGKNTRYEKGNIPYGSLHPEVYNRGKKHWDWKGDKCGYRALHYWLRRVKGIPEVCEFCGFRRTTPKSIHWANIDGKYRRKPDNYIALCKSCHKLYDLHYNHS